MLHAYGATQTLFVLFQHVTKVVRSKLKPYYNSYLLFKTDIILGHNLPELLFEYYVLKPKNNLHFILFIFVLL